MKRSRSSSADSSFFEVIEAPVFTLSGTRNASAWPSQSTIGTVLNSQVGVPSEEEEDNAAIKAFAEASPSCTGFCCRGWESDAMIGSEEEEGGGEESPTGSCGSTQ